jgi:GNAT superfamily N-acetyltransferase
MRTELVANPTVEELKALEDGLAEHARPFAGPHDMLPVAILARDGRGEVVAGLYGHTVWGWLQVKYLWVSQGLRRSGLGRRIMEAAESEASKRGCHAALVDTIDFQAPGFYEKLGYRVFGKLENFPRGHTRIFFHKQLP